MTETERWVTDDDLRRARERFEATVPGYSTPASYSIARLDPHGTVTFAHVNQPGGGHNLPGAVLASVCGHRGGNRTYALSADDVARAIDLLSPAEAAVHWDHPNLWSWRPLLAAAQPESRFVAVFVEDLDAPAVDDVDRALRGRL